MEYKRILVLVLLVASANSFALADDTSAPQAASPSGDAVAPQSDDAQSRLKLDNQKKSNSVDGAEQVDELITNNNLRALSGSLSKWSISSIFNYNGGTIESPLSANRPDISSGSGITTQADLDGTINVKYNLGAKDSLMAGFGVRWIDPLNGGPSAGYAGTTFDAINPQITYQHIYKFAGIQSVLQVGDMQWTQADYTALGYNNQVSIDQENMYEVPGTKLSIGASVGADYQTFDKSGMVGGQDLRTEQSQYMFWLVPELEYQLTAKVNLRTAIGLWMYEHYLSQPSLADYRKDTIYQSVGVGYSVTRDIFLYPNVQYLPENIRSDFTNVGLTATINVF